MRAIPSLSAVKRQVSASARRKRRKLDKAPHASDKKHPHKTKTRKTRLTIPNLPQHPSRLLQMRRLPRPLPHPFLFFLTHHFLLPARICVSVPCPAHIRLPLSLCARSRSHLLHPPQKLQHLLLLLRHLRHRRPQPRLGLLHRGEERQQRLENARDIALHDAEAVFRKRGADEVRQDCKANLKVSAAIKECGGENGEKIGSMWEDEKTKRDAPPIASTHTSRRGTHPAAARPARLSVHPRGSVKFMLIPIAPSTKFLAQGGIATTGKLTRGSTAARRGRSCHFGGCVLVCV
ncbi:hypothetical protein K438DRAFT_52739 [Mycena galopus ATCC 62051]|nr:hypothetical protein K438DRAFT_52739 [Mycena galopus ATCC 62051]